MKNLLTAICCAASLTAGAQVSLVKDINPGFDDSSPVSFSIFNNKLYFIAEHATYGNELWQHDAATGNTVMVADIGVPQVPVSILYYDWQTCALGNYIYFAAADFVHRDELWKYDGTNPPTLVADLYAGMNSGRPAFFNTLGGKLYFSVEADNVGRELHSYDPATNTVSLVHDVAPGATGGGAGKSCVFNGKLYFGANDQTTGGLELWMHDPATNTTAKVGTGTSLAGLGSLTAAFNKLYFAGTSIAFGDELYSYDGVNPPVRLTDLVAGAGSGISDLNGHSILPYKDKLYFHGGAAGGIAVMAYDPATNTAGHAFTAPQFDSAAAGSFCEYAGKLYFSTAADGTVGDELYSYDGVNQPQLAADIVAGSFGSAPADMFAYSNRMFFSANAPATGRELYEYYDASLSVSTIKFTALIQVYPNPSSNIFSMDMNLQQAATFAVQVYDMAGRKVYDAGMHNYESGKHHLSVPAEALTPGNYNLQLRTDGGETFYTTQIVKQ